MPNHRINIALLLLALVALAVPPTNAGEDQEAGWDVAAPPLSVEPMTVRIDVDEGTWMSLDVSPDGRSVVFDLLGDIYEVPLDGGDAVRLLQGHAWDMQPQYSPDGSAIAFTSDRAGGDNIWVLERGSGELRQVTHESFRLLNSPVWHPQGDYIAARKHFTTSRSLGTGEIWLYHAAGAEGQPGLQIVERPDPTFQKELGEPAFSPDGKELYYVQNTTPGNTFIYHQDSNTELFRIQAVDLESGEVRTVAGGSGGAVRPTPSPDGRQLAFVKRVRAESRLFVMDLASGDARMVVDELDPDMQETWAVHGVYPNFDWTPDGNSIVYWAGGQIRRVDVATGVVGVVPFRVRDERTIYPAPRFPVAVAAESFSTRMVRFAAPSPDGTAIAFESLGHIWVKRDDGRPRRLSRDDNGFAGWPVWSPDGRSIYFLGWDDRQLSTLYKVSSRGGRPKPLPLEQGQYAELSISPDGSLLALRKLRGSMLRHPAFDVRPGIYLLDIADGEQHFVSRRGREPVIGQDGRVYVSERSANPSGRGSDTGRTQLVSMTFDGHDAREIVHSPLAQNMVPSPDGRYVAFRENFHIYVAALPKTGRAVAIGPDVRAMPLRRLSDTGGEFLSWSEQGRVLAWSTGPMLKRVRVDEVLSAAADAEVERRVTDLSMQVEHARPAGSVALVGGRVITMDAGRRVIDNATLLIDGNRLVAVGRADEVQVPAGATVVDVRGRTIIPGMVDAHAHGPYGSDGIVPQQNWSLLAHLALGVTTLHDPSSRARHVFAAAEYARVGRILAPRLFSTGEIVYGAKGLSHVPVENLEDARAAVRRLKMQGAISIKNYNQPRREQRQMVIEAARLEGLITVAEGGSLFQLDLNLLADGSTGIEHNLPTQLNYDDVIQFWSGSQAGYTPTLVVVYGGLTSEDYFYQHTEVWKHPLLSRFVPPDLLRARSVRRVMAPEADYRDDDAAREALKLLEAGISVHTGAHGQREGLATHWEMWSFVRGGMTPMQALSLATVNAAGYLGMQADIGSIEAGKLADLVVLGANPLEDIRNSDDIEYVMLNGRLYEAATLKEVFTGDAAPAPFWWQGRAESEIR